MSPTDPAPGVLLARGVARALKDHGFVSVTEFPTVEGRRMDICALGPKGEIWCIEVKSSRTDFISDSKWEDYLPWCEKFFFAVPEGFPTEILPLEHGLILADPWGGEIVRMATGRPLAAARRKAQTLRFARLAGERLLRATDNPGERFSS